MDTVPMPFTDPFVPKLCSRLIGASVAGVSPRTFNRQFLLTGLVEVSDGRVITASLARALNRRISHADYCKAIVVTEPDRRRSRECMRVLKVERTAA